MRRELNMAQGEFTKEEAEAIKEAFWEVFTALPKLKQGQLLGHANDICLFLDAAKAAAPSSSNTTPRNG